MQHVVKELCLIADIFEAMARAAAHGTDEFFTQESTGFSSQGAVMLQFDVDQKLSHMAVAGFAALLSFAVGIVLGAFVVWHILVPRRLVVAEGFFPRPTPTTLTVNLTTDGAPVSEHAVAEQMPTGAAAERLPTEAETASSSAESRRQTTGCPEDAPAPCSHTWLRQPGSNSWVTKFRCSSCGAKRDEDTEKNMRRKSRSSRFRTSSDGETEDE